MNVMLSFRPAVLCCFLFFCSCASIVSRSSYPVRLDSSPQKAKVEVTDRDGKTVYSGLTPANIVLKPAAGYFRKAIYTIKFTKEGYVDRTVHIESSINGWYFGNIVFGGVIGFLVVDPLTGAMYRLNEVVVDETLEESRIISQKGGKRQLRILDINSIPDNWKKHLVQL